MTENGEETQRPTVTQALRTVAEHAEMDEVAVKRVEIDLTASGAVIYRIYPRDGSESERGTVVNS